GRGPSGVILPESMAFSRELLTILVIVALGLTMLAIFLLATAVPRRKTDRSVLSKGERAESVLEEHARAIQQLRGAVKQLAETDARVREHLARSVQRVGLIRYDAFEDMGGQLSFSLALLDEAGDGVVVSAINGRQDTRVYAKPVRAADSQHNLSDEEADAIRQAMASTPAVSA
ncbi:MAG TPA: DUF4446 family protein, partial [Actinomycetota bacterium]|nr:DUF4446 family protein [Actinomycetota bacterium]